jgi:hypothetical protein
MVGKVIIATITNGEIDKITESYSGFLESLQIMGGVKVKDNACPWFTSPGEKRIAILFNHPDGAVN